MNDKAGNAELRAQNDKMGNAIVSEAFDAAGAPINLVAGYQRLVAAYDGRGNLVEETHFAADGKPAQRDGCHRLRYEHDERGNIIHSACLDQFGNPALVTGYDYAVWTIHYNGTGKADEFTYYDKEGKPVAEPGAVFRIKVENDAEGNETSVAYFSAAGQPMALRSGVHKEVRTFEGGRKMRTTYLGVDGRPAEVDGGYVTSESGFDSHGNGNAWLSWRRRAAGSQHTSGVAIKRASFDACGRETET